MSRIALIALLLTGCAGSPPPAAPPADADLVVATYNVNFGLAGDPATLAAIRATRADVVLLQETTPAWEAAIRRALGRRYPHIRFLHSSEWPAGGMGILSRFPVESPLGVSPSAIGFFPAFRAVVRAPAGAVQLVNLHLKPPVSRSGSYVSGYFSTPRERAAEMRGHLGLFRSDLPTIALGDFNEERGGGLGLLKQRRLRDTISSTPTWRWRVGPLTLRMQLDHIVYDAAKLECLDARVLPLGRSDHLPVVAWFRLLPRA